MTALIGGPWIVYLAIKLSCSVRGRSAPVSGHVSHQRKGLVYGVLSVIAICMFLVSLRFGGTGFTTLNQFARRLCLILCMEFPRSGFLVILV